jgi:hypothetical protein
MRRRRLAPLAVTVALALVLGAALPGAPAHAAAAKVETWLDASPPVRANDLRVVYPDPFRPGVVWLGGVGGILYSDDDGDSWVDSLRISARTRTIGAPAAGGAAGSGEVGEGDRDSDSADDSDTSDDSSADAADAEDTAAASAAGDEDSKEELLEEVTDAATEELADEFGIDRDDVEVIFPDELESLINERFAELLADAEDDESTGAGDTVRLDAIESIASGAAAPAILYAAGSAGMYVTHDDGTTWEARLVPGGWTVTAVAVDPTNSEHVLASTIRGLWESDDGALTWTETGPTEIKGKPVAGVEWELDGAHRAAAWTSGDLALSGPGAADWTGREIAAASGAGRIRGFCFVGAPAGRIAIAGDEEGFVSDDAGESWWPLPDLPQTPTAIAGRPGSDLIWAAGTSEVYRIDSGGMAVGWTELAEGWATARPRSLAADPRTEGDGWVVTGTGVFRWTHATLEELAEKERKMLAARFDADPRLEATIAAALEHARLDAGMAVETAKRARIAALLPSVRLYYNWRSEGDAGGDGSPVTGLSADYNSDWRVVALLSWDLSGVGFHRSEVSVAALVASTAAAREELIDRVVAAYAQRRAAAIALVRAPEANLKARLGAELKFVELTAELDGLTGNWFSKNVKKKDVVLPKKK